MTVESLGITFALAQVEDSTTPVIPPLSAEDVPAEGQTLREEYQVGGRVVGGEGRTFPVTAPLGGSIHAGRNHRRLAMGLTVMGRHCISEDEALGNCGLHSAALISEIASRLHDARRVRQPHHCLSDCVDDGTGLAHPDRWRPSRQLGRALLAWAYAECEYPAFSVLGELRTTLFFVSDFLAGAERRGRGPHRLSLIAPMMADGPTAPHAVNAIIAVIHDHHLVRDRSPPLPEVILTPTGLDVARQIAEEPAGEQRNGHTASPFFAISAGSSTRGMPP